MMDAASTSVPGPVGDFVVVVVNVRGLGGLAYGHPSSSKLEELKLVVGEVGPDVLVLTETQPRHAASFECLRLDGYRAHRAAVRPLVGAVGVERDGGVRVSANYCSTVPQRGFSF